MQRRQVERKGQPESGAAFLKAGAWRIATSLWSTLHGRGRRQSWRQLPALSGESVKNKKRKGKTMSLSSSDA
uniref:Uncharacterized protein n=1 Tax=Thermogemmatispora argillosa TaxID=2045280 RepID=A0A455T637_9CHLR|nr:hypothetical protein KTA_31710 [Thermogemmatispora argillosa]